MTTFSPVLWRKLPGSRSAGRVQSVALRLICEREADIEVFVPREYWDIGLTMQTGTGATFAARLTEYNGVKLDKFALGNEGAAKDVERVLKSTDFKVTTITPRTVRRAPYPPFSTSTLQMEASRKLGFGAKRTMQVAQKLYEEGLITYMRTDGISVSVDAINDARKFIEKDYGAKYVPDSPRMYKTKVKNAQEAHEAIRPTDLSKRADMLGDSEQAKLYDLIWKRMVASQMEVALYDQVGVDMHDATKRHALRATGSVLKFDGFLCLYQEVLEEDEKKPDADEESAEDTSQRLPQMDVGEPLRTAKVEAAQHFTQPPPRFSEASLVKRLEELGIGRPSTYASIISVLVDRNYVKLDKRRFTAEALGRIVTAFLMSYFERYVEYNFTANLEENLDKIADGKRDWKEELRLFWKDFHAKVEDSKKLTISEVLTHVEELLEPYIFGLGDSGAAAKVCPTCKTGALHLKTGKFGSFLGCSNYPECNFTRQLTGSAADAAADAAAGISEEFPRTLGVDPVSGLSVSIRKGPYGVYVQLGEEKKPKRSSLPKGTHHSTVDLEKALSLLALPREVGLHPETNLTIVANIGRFGPYLLHDGKYANLGPEDDVLTIGMNRAVTLIAEAAEKKKNGGGRGGAPEPLKDLGAHPESGEKVVILKGRYGPYIKYAGKNITLPKDIAPEAATMESVLALLPAAGAKGGAKKKAPAKKAAAKKPAAKKAPVKKTAVKKAS
jgi:DNA topoisomerase I